MRSWLMPLRQVFKQKRLAPTPCRWVSSPRHWRPTAWLMAPARMLQPTMQWQLVPMPLLLAANPLLQEPRHAPLPKVQLPLAPLPRQLRNKPLPWAVMLKRLANMQLPLAMTRSLINSAPSPPAHKPKQLPMVLWHWLLLPMPVGTIQSQLVLTPLH